MAAKTWSAAANGNWNVDGNWSGGTKPVAGDDITFDATSTKNCTCDTVPSIGSLVMTTGYTGTFSLGTIALTCTGNMTFASNATIDGSGACSITLTGASSVFTVAGSTVTMTGCALRFDGTTACQLTDNRGATFKNLTLGASAVLTANGIQTTTFAAGSGNTPITLGASATLTNNILFVCSLSGSPTAISLGAGYTLNGTSRIQFAHSGNGTVTIPAMTSTTWIEFLVTSTGTTTIDFAGAINMSNAAFNIATMTSSNTLTWNTNNYAITCSTFRSGGNSSGTGIFIGNLGSSVITTGAYLAYSNNTNSTYNFQTSQWTCTGSWTFGSNHTVDPGTSLITFSGTAAHTITLNGKSLYDVTINNTATAGTTFADAPSLHTLTVSATNTQAVTWVGFVLTASGNVTIDGSGTLNCGNGITANGASSNVHFGSALGTVTATSCAITMNTSTAGVLDCDKATTFLGIIIGNSSVVTFNGAASVIFSSTSAPLTFTNGGTLTLSSRMDLSRSTTGNIITVSAGTPTISIGDAITSRWDINGPGITLSIPALTITGGTSSLISITNQGFSGTWQMTGNLVVPGILDITSLTFNVTNTFNTQNFALSAGTLEPGASAAGGTFNINYGSSLVSVSSYTGNVYNTGTINDNFGTSVFSVAGSWTFGSNHTITGTAASQSITITNTATITSNGKVFPGALVINAAGETITLADALSVAGNLTVTAGTLAGAFATTCAGDVTVSVSTTFNRLILTKPTTRTVTIGAGTTLTLTNLTNTNVNGSAGALTQWRSSIPGTTYNMSIPAPITLQYQNPRDNVASALVTADDYTSTDGGHNTNWKFPPVGSSGYYAYW